MKRVFVLLVFTATFAVAVNAQRYGNTTCGLTPGPCVERMIRQGYAPVDYMLNNFGGYGGYGYGGYYGSGRIGTSAIVGGVAGFAGGLIASAISHRSDNRTTYVTTAEPGGGQAYAEPRQQQVVFAASKPQKPLDCRKPAGKRGRNEAAWAAAEQGAAARQQAGNLRGSERRIGGDPG